MPKWDTSLIFDDPPIIYISVDASPWTIVPEPRRGGNISADIIRHLVPDAKIIVILRDPIER